MNYDEDDDAVWRPGPLRAIVAEVLPAIDVNGRRKVRLECGHEVWCSTAALYRARCRQCRDAAVERLNERKGTPP